MNGIVVITSRKMQLYLEEFSLNAGYRKMMVRTVFFGVPIGDKRILWVSPIGSDYLNRDCVLRGMVSGL